MAIWTKALLGQVLTLQRGFDLAEKLRVPGPVPIVSSSGISGYHEVSKVRAPGVVTGRYGTLGQVFFMGVDFWPLNTTLWVKDFKGNNPRFVSFLLQTLNFANQNAAGAVPGINRNALHLLPVRVPDIDTQNRIAEILSAYDDLIENNTRRIKILEEMAQMTYREWFVNFRFPGHEKVSMVDSELGPIPEGWGSPVVRDVLALNIGGGWGDDQESTEFSAPAFVIRGTDIPGARHGSIANCPLRWHKESNFKSRRVQADDIIFEVSGGSKGQPVGRSMLLSATLLGQFSGDVICASFCKLLRPKGELEISTLLFCFLTEAYSNGLIDKYQVQSTGITNFKFTEFVDNARMLSPNASVLANFNRIVKPMLNLVALLGKKNENLRTTRDLLLPRLISGEIPIEAAEEKSAELLEAVAQTA